MAGWLSKIKKMKEKETVYINTHTLTRAKPQPQPHTQKHSMAYAIPAFCSYNRKSVNTQLDQTLV